MRKSKVLLLLFLVASLVFCTASANTGENVASGGNVSIGGGSVDIGGGSIGGGGGVAGTDLKGACGDNAKWSLSQDGTLTISGSGTIDNNGFTFSYSEVVKLVIEEGITGIGESTFSDFNGLQEAVLPESLTVIGERAFMYCSQLTKLSMGSNVTALTEYAFGYCGFETFTVPDGVTTIDDYSIIGDNLRIVYVPDSVTSIAQYAFGYGGIVLIGNEGSYAQQFAEEYSYNGVSFITEDNLIVQGNAGADITYTLDIPNGTLTLNGKGNMNNFYHADSPWSDFASLISEVVIDKNITSIGDNSFYNLSRLKSVTVGENITRIGDYAFYSCSSLASAGLHNNLTYIGEYAFASCGKLTQFPAGDKLEYVGDYAFKYVSSLKDLTISDSIETIEPNAFASVVTENLYIGKTAGKDIATSSLQPVKVTNTITVDSGNSELVVVDNVMMDIAKTTLIKAGALTGEYTVPESVKRITPYAFFGKEITAVTLPEGLEEIGGKAFNSCNRLNRISIPLSVCAIGERAFRDTTSFTIAGYSNSIAEKYANDTGCTFESLGVAPVSVIKVKNSYELLDAIRRCVSAEIVLADGVYAFEEPVTIKNGYNLTIRAENPGKAEILTFDGYQPVVKFQNCENVTMSGLILGHYSLVYRGNNCGSGSSSGGYVVYSHRSMNITIDYCDLYGCGTYAAYLSYTGSMTIKNSVLRDCSQGIAYITGREYSIDEYDVLVENCIISGNAYKEEYANNQAAILNYSNPVEIKNCTFINNYSTQFTHNELKAITECRFADNAWDGFEPKEYGVCLNGITWEIVTAFNSLGEIEKVLRIGFDLDCGSFVIDSEVGAVLPYSTSSLPWKGKHYDRIELAEGVTYDDINVHSACGYDMRWTLNKDTGVLIIEGSGEMFRYRHWEYLEEYIKTVYVSDDITYIYRPALEYTLYFREIGERIDGLLYAGNILLDANVDSGKVTVREGTVAICEYAFEYCGMTEVVIPDSVTVIPEYAFAYAQKLEKVVLPDTITEIGNYAFSECYALGEITLPQGLVKIGDGAFSRCKSLADIIIPEGVSEVGESLFNDCKTLKKAVLPNGIKELSQNMFWGCSSLEEVIIPDSVEKISYGAFRECTSLTEFIIPDGIVYVGNAVFEECSGLTKLTVPSSVTELYYCTSNCTSLSEIIYEGTKAQWENMQYNSYQDSSAVECIIRGADFTLSPPQVTYRYVSYLDGVEITGAKSFVTDLVVPAEIDGYKVRSIANDAFTGNSNIKTIVLPDNLESVRSSAFEGTGFYNNKSNWDNGILYIGSYLICADKEISGDITIKEGTKVICQSAFLNCTGITSVSMPQSVESVVYTAFSGCSGLKTAVFPDNVKNFYGEVFYNCSSLESVTLPKNLEMFDPYFYGCTALENVYIDEGNPNYCSVDGILYDSTKAAVVYVPTARCGTVVVPDGVTTIMSRAFMFSNAEKLSLPESLTTIDERVFNGCYSISEIQYAGTQAQWETISIGNYGNDILNEVRIIGNGFSVEPEILYFSHNGDGTATLTHCASNVKTITIPARYEGAAVTQVSENAFNTCRMLEHIDVEAGNTYFKSVDGVLFTADMKTLIVYPAKKSAVAYTVPETVENLGNLSFAYSNLEEITLSPNMKTIGYSVFEGCTKLRKVVILDGTETIGEFAFGPCISLETIVIPESVVRIENYAFNNCSRLKNVIYAGSKADWNSVFKGSNNDYLINAEITFAKKVPAVEYTEFAGVEYLPDDEIAVVCVYVDGVNEDFTMLAAIYDEHNRLVAMEKAIVTIEKSGRVVTVQIPSVKMDMIPTLKLFFWDDENISIPVGKPIVLENIEI